VRITKVPVSEVDDAVNVKTEGSSAASEGTSAATLPVHFTCVALRVTVVVPVGVESRLMVNKFSGLELAATYSTMFAGTEPMARDRQHAVVTTVLVSSASESIILRDAKSSE
jgi:hypothetical protein